MISNDTQIIYLKHCLWISRKRLMAGWCLATLLINGVFFLETENKCGVWSFLMKTIKRKQFQKAENMKHESVVFWKYILFFNFKLSQYNSSTFLLIIATVQLLCIIIICVVSSKIVFLVLGWSRVSNLYRSP